MLALEVKGTDSPQDKAKRLALDEWIGAINASGGFGRWDWDVAFAPHQIEDIIRRRAGHRFAAHSLVRLRRAFTAARIDIPAGTEGVIVDSYPSRDAYEVEVSLAPALTVTVFGSDLEPIDA